LRASYRTGKEDTDIAHFYFELKNYYNYKHNRVEELENRLKDMRYRCNEDKYAFFDDSFDREQFVSESKERASINLIYREIVEKYFKYKDKNLASFYVTGIFSGKEKKVVKPKYRPSAQIAYYRLKELSEYQLEYGTYHSGMPSIPYKVKVEIENENFDNVSKVEMPVSSPYNEHQIGLMPKYLDSRSFSEINIVSEIGRNDDLIDFTVKLPIMIRRTVFNRLVGVVRERSLQISLPLLGLYISGKYESTTQDSLELVFGTLIIVVFLSILASLFKG